MKKLKEELDEILLNNPTDITTLRKLGMIYLEENDIKKTIEICNRIRKLDQDTLEKWNILENLYSKLVMLDEEDYGAWYRLGWVYSKKQNGEKTIESYSKALQIMCDQNLSFFVSVTVNVEEVIAFCNQYLEENEGTEEIFLLLANAYFLTDDYEEAIPLYKKVLRLNKNNVDALIYLGASYYQNGAYEELDTVKESIKCYETALKLIPTNLKALEWLGIVYSDEKEFEKGIEIYRKMTKLDPANKQAWYDLACQESQGNLLKNAIASLAKAIELDEEFKEIAKYTYRKLDNIKNTKEFQDLVEN